MLLHPISPAPVGRFVGKTASKGEVMGKLNSMLIQKTTAAGRYGDGDGLYLQVSKGGHKSWIFRFMINSRSREMGLGSLSLVSLVEARIKASDCKRLLLDGKDPITFKHSERQTLALQNAKGITFKESALAYIEAKRPAWKNIKHANQWSNTLETYVNPIIGHLSIQDVDTTLVMKVLEPIWYKKTETASRVRNRIELVISWATSRGYRTGENPARWRGHLDNLLPKRSSIQQVKHFSALPMNEISSFMTRLQALDGTAALALEFQILTACRTNEVRGARWEEINFETALWIIPASRMKAKREHRVPLSSRPLEILRRLKSSFSISEYVFPGRSNGTLSNNAFLSILKKRLKSQVTAHGFRSTFSDWASEKTAHSREVIEMSLAHSIKDATEAAYRRGDLLLKRIALMNDWAKFCTASTPIKGEVIELASASDLPQHRSNGGCS
jgi:integrase